MGGANREGLPNPIRPKPSRIASLTDNWNTGGKAKPLKAPKKGAKDLDEDDLAYLEKKRAGMSYIRDPYRSEAFVVADKHPIHR